MNQQWEPCPHCGNEKIVLLGNVLTATMGAALADCYCQKCGAKAPQKVWNTRLVPPARAVPDEAAKVRVMDAIAAALGDVYDCNRVWEAWHVGTMSADDFSLVTDDSDRLAELADAAIAAIVDAPAEPARAVGDIHDKTLHDIAKSSEFVIKYDDHLGSHTYTCSIEGLQRFARALLAAAPAEGE